MSTDGIPLTQDRGAEELGREDSLPDVSQLNRSSGDEVALEQRDTFLHLRCTVMEIDTTTHQFIIESKLTFYWKTEASDVEEVDDGNLAIKDNGSNLPVDDGHLFENGRRNTSFHTHDDHLTYDPETKLVSWTLEVMATLSEVFELNEFPFDRQFLTVIMKIRPEWKLLAEQPSWVPDKLPGIFGGRMSSGLLSYDMNTPLINFDDPEAPHAIMRVERIVAYYLPNMILPVFLIVGLTVTAFSIDGLSDRMQLVPTLLLTLIAFKYSLSADLPVTPYLTFIDKYILFSYAVMMIIVVENVARHFVDEFGYEFGDDMDTYSIYSFGAFWVGLHLVFSLYVSKGWMRVSWDDMADEQEEEAGMLYPREVIPKTPTIVFD